MPKAKTTKSKTPKIAKPKTSAAAKKSAKKRVAAPPKPLTTADLNEVSEKELANGVERKTVARVSIEDAKPYYFGTNPAAVTDDNKFDGVLTDKEDKQPDKNVYDLTEQLNAQAATPQPKQSSQPSFAKVKQYSAEAVVLFGRDLGLKMKRDDVLNSTAYKSVNKLGELLSAQFAVLREAIRNSKIININGGDVLETPQYEGPVGTRLAKSDPTKPKWKCENCGNISQIQNAGTGGMEVCMACGANYEFVDEYVKEDKSQTKE